jgi:hypothetical protein
VQLSRHILDIEEVIVYASFLDKVTLRIGKKLLHERPKPKSKNFCQDLCNRVNDANWSKLGDVFAPLLFRQECNVCRIKPMKIGRTEAPKKMQYP